MINTQAQAPDIIDTASDAIVYANIIHQHMQAIALVSSKGGVIKRPKSWAHKTCRYRGDEADIVDTVAQRLVEFVRPHAGVIDMSAIRPAMQRQQVARVVDTAQQLLSYVAATVLGVARLDKKDSLDPWLYGVVRQLVEDRGGRIVLQRPAGAVVER